MAPYNPANWYWIVAGSTSQVWSSARAAYVPVADTTYAAWLSGGGRPTRIDSEASLQGVFAAQYAAGWPPTLAQQATALMAAGLTITSTGTPAISGVYACDADMQSHLQAEMLAVLVAGAFADGATSVAWPDVGGAVHVIPSVAAFKTFALAIAGFVAAIAKVVNGSSTTLPVAAATIP